jgi:signal transduction histidine kinase
MKSITQRILFMVSAQNLEIDLSRVEQFFVALAGDDAIEEKHQAAGSTKRLGEVTISCRLDNKVVIIGIKDNGAGMNEETKVRLFEPFYTTKSVGEGTGLGLSISYGIVQKHGGELTVTSKQGEGTEFTLMLPRITDN